MVCGLAHRTIRSPGGTLATPAPDHTTVERRWPRDPGAPGKRASRTGFAYRAYVPGTIAQWDPSLPSSLAADLARAETAIRTLDGRGPLLASLAWPLLRAEAIASSNIEGLGVGHHQLALAAFGADDDPLAQVVLGNVRALRRVIDVGASRLDTRTLDDLHRVLLAGTRDAARAGRIRDVQNWIGGKHPNPRGADFIPPPPEEVPGLVTDLLAFCRRDDLPVVAQAAIAHAQFETIHPYLDGNGRLGKVLVQMILRRRGLAQEVFPPISLVLGGEDDRYVGGLTAFRDGDAGQWLAFFAQTVFRAARAGEGLADGIRTLQDHWHEQAHRPRRGSAAATLITRLPEEPVVDLASARRLTGTSTQAALRAIDRLAAADVLRECSGRRRGRVWEAVGLFALLDGLETRVGRTSRRRPATNRRGH